MATGSWLCDGDMVVDLESGYALRNRWLSLRIVQAQRGMRNFFLCTQECVNVRVARSERAMNYSNIFSWFE